MLSREHFRKIEKFVIALLLLCMPMTIVHGAQTADMMTKLTVQLQSADAPEGSFAAKPKTIYRSGNSYCRTEELPDLEHGIHGLMIINEPDAWMVNLFSRTARHIVDPGPTFNCRLPIFSGDQVKSDPLHELEFGREIEYFKGKGIQAKQGSVLKGKRSVVYRANVGDSQLILFATEEPEKPIALERQHAGLREIFWYEAYDNLPFDPQLFAKPEGVKIEDVR